MRPPRPHSPGPWSASGCEVTSADGKPIGKCHEPPNARRIVAAVNACEGITIRDLEGGILADLFFQCGQLKHPRIQAILEKFEARKKSAAPAAAAAK